MAEDLKDLVFKRGLIKSSLTRFKNFIESDKSSNKSQLNNRLIRFKEIIAEFDSVQASIELVDTECDDHSVEREQFEDSYFDLLEKAEQLLSPHELPHLDRHSSADVHSQHSIHTNQVKLPTIQLPTFSGKYEDWLQFHELFQSVIENNTSLSAIQKFFYLKSSLQGPALDVIQSLEVSEINYETAWELLKSRFDNKRVIVNNHVSSLFDIQKLEKESGIGLRTMLDTLNKHIRSLTSLGQPTDKWDTLLVYLVTKKLDYNSLRLWESHHVSTELPKFSELTKFLEDRCNVLEAIRINNPLSSSSKSNHQNNISKPQQPPRKTFTSSIASSYTPTCQICKTPHKIYQCEKFNKMSVSERHQTVRKLGLCINCFSNKHLIKDCTASKCKICQCKHNTLLHFERSNAEKAEKGKQPEPQPQTPSTTLAASTCNQVLLSTAIVTVRDTHGNPHPCRILLDSGSQSNFITAKMADQLQLKTSTSNIPIVGIGQYQSNITKSVECTIHSRHNSYKATIKCLILPSITHKLPTLPIDIRDWKIPNNITLADPSFFEPSTIDMLVGAEYFFKILSVGQFKPHKSGPIFQKTSLGWIASGTVLAKQNQPKHSFLSIDSTLCNQLKRFWELEDCSTAATNIKTEDDVCEDHFVETTSRNPDTGRYTVKLPLRPIFMDLGESFKVAESRFLQVERKFLQNPKLQEAYKEFMEDYERLGHMELVEHLETTNPSYYIPHLAVFREDSSTTKVRVVFDASAKTTSGLSLNDTLMVGPTIQNDVFSIISRFRFHRYVLTADIEKMYRQIDVHIQHQDLQRILWRKNRNEPIKIYRLKTVTYGTASAPFLAVRSLHQLAEDEKSSYPLASKIITTDFYVDDLLTGTDSLNEAKIIQIQLTDLLKEGCFNLRKWNSNSSEILEKISPEDRADSFDTLSNKQSIKVLGMLWFAERDTFQYTVKNMSTAKITKRTVLAEIASLFDPLGLVGPVTLKSKIFLQTLWQLKLSWDESLPAEHNSWWQSYRQQLASLNDLHIARLIKAIDSSKIDLHGFCDASQKAYGACIYIRSTTRDGDVAVNLLCSKSRVAPLTPTTMPRLELCGALLLSTLFNKVLALKIPFDSCTLWSDSTIVLAWIKSNSSSLKTFVGNRVHQIQELTQGKSTWKHVRTEQNPADLISRGSSPAQLIDSSSIWWHGPNWLCDEPETWPSSEPSEVTELPETRPQQASLTTSVKDPAIDITRYSSLIRAQRVTAWCIRFIKRLKTEKTQNIGNTLHPLELQEAIGTLLKIDQQLQFSEEYSRLETKQNIKQNSKLAPLQPFMDDAGLLRVGGRLKNAKISIDQKHPILLAPKSHLTHLIIKHEHYRNLHAAPQLLLTSLRQKYWPLRGRETVRKIVHNCITCFKTNPRGHQPLMGDLPTDRLQVCRPFTNTGTDLCGPVFLKSSTRKNATRTKAYIVVFVCLSTKAIHLELVSDMTTESFLAALKRFTSRRGICKNIYSDNGKNLVGANNELKELKNLFDSEEGRRRIVDGTSADFINWHFIPPRSPHFGGLWEAGVKAVKYHLRRVVGEALLTFEDLYTTLTAIEACVNSRPLTPLSSDPHDLTPLTPGHFLTGRPLTAIPEPSLNLLPVNRLSHWQRLQQLTEHFWSRWSKEYLSSLQQRSKWRKDDININVGQLVVVKEENVPPLRWVTARVTAVHPGADGRVRVATIRTSAGTYKRATNRLCVLPTDDSTAGDQ